MPDDDWTDYLRRLAHGIPRMALTHPRVFPLVATHPNRGAVDPAADPLAAVGQRIP